METLKIYDLNDYDPLLPRIVRNAVKAIIFAESKIATVYYPNHNLYDFPGGGIEDGETNTEALIREIKEETGLIIKPLSIKEFSKDVVIHKDRHIDVINEKHFDYYFCDVEDVYTEQHLTEEELSNELQFKFVCIDEAISTNEAHMQQGFHWVECPTYRLKLLKVVQENIKYIVWDDSTSVEQTASEVAQYFGFPCTQI